MKKLRSMFLAAVATVGLIVSVPQSAEAAEGKKNSPAARVHIFGTLSGTEPKAGRHHTSWGLELPNGEIYIFDAGENCGRAAYLRGLDITRIKAIFISHSHADHTAGLIHLFAVIGKVRRLDKSLPPGKIDIYFPDPGMAEPFLQVLKAFGAFPRGLEFNFHLNEHGKIFDDGTVKVEMLGNDHIKVAPGERKRAYSFRIDVNGRRIIYSGDVRKPAELDKWCSEGCDLAMMESGHHFPPDVCARWKDFPVKHLLFIHHGRAYLNYPQETMRKSRRNWKNKLDFAEEDTVIAL